MTSVTLNIHEIAKAIDKHMTSAYRRAVKESWPYTEQKVNGGLAKMYILSTLPPEIQITLVEASTEIPLAWERELCPEAALAAARKRVEADIKNGATVPAVKPGNNWPARYGSFEEAIRPAARFNYDPAKAIGPDDLENDALMRRSRIVQEASHPPMGWAQGRRAWVQAVADKHGTTFQTIYKWMRKYGEGGLAGLKHTKSTKGRALAWDNEALKFWIGLCIQNETRGRSQKSLYWNVLVVEAARREWAIGSERSAAEWAAKSITPQMRAYQRGGLRALDNSLPPVLRSYADLRPFQIICGDQHRFDFWVHDPVTGQIYRPEGYVYQCLRTRLIYGAAVAEKYDSHLMGLALHCGMRIFGAFESTYNDNGKPEQSRYIMQVTRDIRRLGLEIGREIDGRVDMADDEDLPLVKNGQRFAIVRNAKAKMIEGTFRFLEQLMMDRGVPGRVKKLGGPGEENEVDEKEIMALAEDGKLLTPQEFALEMYRTMDFYNRTRPHRGVIREWAWKPKPKQVRPMDVLAKCYEAGWRPKRLSQEALDLLFLKRATRVVDRGRITFQGELYDCQALLHLHGQRVEVRYDPMDTSELIVFQAGQCLGRAEIAERSSMIDQDLASDMIARKRRLRRDQIDEYRKLTAGLPDTRQYSQVPKEEKAAAVVGKERTRRAKEQAERYRVMSQEELDRGLANIEAATVEMDRPKARPVPPRPSSFIKETDRLEWCQKTAGAGVALSAEDQEFVDQQLAAMDEQTRDYWGYVKACGWE